MLGAITKTRMKMQQQQMKTEKMLHNLNTDDLNDVIHKIASNKQVIRLYSLDQVIKSIDSSMITQIQMFVFQKPVDLLDFVKGMLKVIQHKNTETIYLTISLIDMFKNIQESYNLEQKITLTDFTSYICDIIKSTLFKMTMITQLKARPSLQLRSKTVISIMQYLPRYSKLALIGSRIYTMSFTHNLPAKEQLYPIHIDFHFNNNQLLLATRKDLRFYNMNNGQLSHTLNNLCQNDEITVFRVIRMGHTFFVGYLQGASKIFNFNGELLHEFRHCQMEITNFKLDVKNDIKIVVSDSSAMLYWKNQYLKEIDHTKSISCLELSVYHSLLLISDLNVVHVWEYELGKLVHKLQFESEVKSIYCLNAIQLILVGTSNNRVTFISFEDRQQHHSFTISDKFIELNSVPVKFLVQSDHLQKQFNLYIGQSNGYVSCFKLENEFKMRYCPPQFERINYNPFRQTVDYNQNATISQISSQVQINKIEAKKEFKAHEDSITCFNLLEMDNDYLITGDQQSHLKIWTSDGKLLCFFNVMHPLPFLWNFNDQQFKKYKRKILFAIKVIDTIFKKNHKRLLPSEEQKITLKPLFQELRAQNEFRQENEGQDEIILIRDEYSPRDIYYEKVKEQYSKELQGNSVKQLETIKKMRQTQQMIDNVDKEDSQEQKRRKVLEIRKKELLQEEEREEIIQFLHPQKHKKMQGYQQLSAGTLDLEKKLNIIRMKRNFQSRKSQMLTNKFYDLKKKNLVLGKIMKEEKQPKPVSKPKSMILQIVSEKQLNPKIAIKEMLNSKEATSRSTSIFFEKQQHVLKDSMDQSKITKLPEINDTNQSRIALKGLIQSMNRKVQKSLHVNNSEDIQVSRKSKQNSLYQPSKDKRNMFLEQLDELEKKIQEEVCQQFKSMSVADVEKFKDRKAIEKITEQYMGSNKSNKEYIALESSQVTSEDMNQIGKLFQIEMSNIS